MPPVTHRPGLTAAAALDLVAAAVAHANRNGWTVAIVVTDPEGATLAALRMEGASPPILDFAADKAYTAATMRRPSAAFGDRMDSAPGLRLGLSTRTRLLTWGGGIPVVHDGTVVGAIGVSGAQSHEDVACAEAAIAAMGLAAG